MYMVVPQDKRNAVVTVPAPIGGLNARDSLAAMPPTDAVVLQNWWPQPYGVSVRRGYKEWATEMPGVVESLAIWSSTDGTQKVFAWSDGGLYDISVSGPVGAPLLTLLTNSIWDYCNPVNSAGSFMIALNGKDDGILYGPTGLAAIISGDGTAANTWAGIDPKKAVNPVVHQHRLWVLEAGTSVGWYLPPDAIQGIFVKYDFGPLFSRGGYAQLMSTWTLDDGNGAEDHLIVVSSRGEAVVFGGTNPDSDQTWQLVGVYYIGAPVAGRRCHTKAGGDQFILTQQGLISMNKVLVSTKVNEEAAKVTTTKIQFLVSALTTDYGASFGWDLKYFPKFNMVLINVPSIVDGGNIQLAANQITNAWTEFTGIDAACWASFNSSPLFGDYTGRVLQFWEGGSDNVKLDNTGGVGVTSSVMTAYSYLGEMAVQKQVSMYRPTFVVTAKISISSAILYDFITNEPVTPSPPPQSYASIWGSGLWNQAIWSGGQSVQREWFQAQGMGVAAALRMVTQTAAEVLWVATDYSVIKGEGLF